MYPTLRRYTAKKILNAYELVISAAGSNIYINFKYNRL